MNYEYITGIEGTNIYRSGQDVLDTTQHTIRYKEDLEQLKNDGMKTFRCCIPWHKIEKVRGTYDWRWLDDYLDCVQSFELHPIADTLHHTSFPDWLEGGFKDSRFSDAYVNFLRAFSERYPWIKRYTVFNEPFVTTWFCFMTGYWHPKKKGHKAFVPALLNVCNTICLASNMLTKKVSGVTLMHPDSAEHHTYVDDESQLHAKFCNELRFIILDLILGKVTVDHALYSYLLEYATKDQIVWFQSNKTVVHVIGLDYYSHSEFAWSKEGAVPFHKVLGFAKVAMHWVDRYQIPIMLAETNIRGYISTRISWLKHMVEQCDLLSIVLEEKGLPFQGFCWYCFIDSTDWDSLVTKPDGNIDPQGLYWLDSEGNRHSSELSKMYRALAQGTIRGADITPYLFEDRVLGSPRNFMRNGDGGRMIRNYLPFMTHWKWVNPRLNEKEYVESEHLIQNFITATSQKSRAGKTYPHAQHSGKLMVVANLPRRLRP